MLREVGNILGFDGEIDGRFGEVLKIDRLVFGESARWTMRTFAKSLQCVPGQYRWGVVNCAFCGDVAGYLIVSSNLTHFEILRLAVKPVYQRQGFGRQLVGYLSRMLKDGCIDSVLVNIPESNLSAQLFFRQLGFHAIDTIRGYHGDESAYTMARSLDRCSGADDARISRPRANGS